MQLLDFKFNRGGGVFGVVICDRRPPPPHFDQFFSIVIKTVNVFVNYTMQLHVEKFKFLVAHTILQFLVLQVSKLYLGPSSRSSYLKFEHSDPPSSIVLVFIL